jgi:hypothetical protein|tara:strand:- start:347 stop:547 length:201 start_codon:yes stop_codon:yes gene_type:complete
MNKDFEKIGQIVRDEEQELLITKGNYYKIDVVDFRWYRSEKPTRKGIRLNREEAKELLEILRREFE